MLIKRIKVEITTFTKRSEFSVLVAQVSCGRTSKSTSDRFFSFH